jgi:hypothetical protein
MTRGATALVLCLLAASAEAAVRRVWAVHDGEKVDRDARDHPARDRNAAWDGRTIRLVAARNEIVAFQVIVETDGRGVGQLGVSLSRLTRPSGEAIAYRAPDADPTLSAGRPIQIFAVHYMHVAIPSHASWVFRRGSPAAPRDSTGWKPVQLVPERARKGGLPIAVGPDRTQAIWIEIYTGRGRPAGLYTGEVLVDADDIRRAVPIELELLDFDLPDRNSMHAMLYYEPSQPVRYHGRNLDPSYHRLAHRHRTELVHAYDERAVTSALGRFTGTDFTPAAGYQGPGEGVGNVIVPRSFYGPGREFQTRESAWRASDAWTTFLRATLPEAITFLYMPDEPAPSQFPRIRELASYVHDNPGPGRTLPVMVTHKYDEGLAGAVDIWNSGPLGFDIARARSERAAGRAHWFYNGGRPAAGAIVIDSPATDPRATIWAAFKHDVEVYFYWHAVHWRHNSQKRGDRDQNVWAESITFDNREQPDKRVDDQGYIHGDGVLIYPGEERLHPAEDRGVPGPVATVQLANFRRGLQDHQYLTMARRLGLAREVQAALDAIVPRVFSEAGERVSFPEAGDAYEFARIRLARALAFAPATADPRKGR